MSGRVTSDWPAYRALGAKVLHSRAQDALALLRDCRLCPRACGVDRLANRRGTCRSGRSAALSGAFAHHGEEACLSGWGGSGTIFFGHCNLRCVFCQNHEISQPEPDAPSIDEVSARQLAEVMLSLQRRGCHNVNLVTPSHVVPQILEALALAVDDGLALPVVYNTSAYDGPIALDLMAGVIDIYMPDFKMWSEPRSRQLLTAADYAAAARQAIVTMHDQVGDLEIESDSGLARRGVLIRHLVMPGLLDETVSVLAWLSREIGRDTYVNLMDQYRPAGAVGIGRHAAIDRTVTRAEFREALAVAAALGLHRLDGYRRL